MGSVSALACWFEEFLTRRSIVVFELDASGQSVNAKVERGGELPLGVAPSSAQ